MVNLFLSVFLLCIARGVYSAAPEKTYRAAVLQLEKTSPVNVYLPYINEAKEKGAEIIVFPELGVIQHKKESLEVIEVGSTPCDEKSGKPIQEALSCQARKNSIYVVFDMAEKGEACKIGTKYCHYGFYIYNCAVVMDRKGVLIRKYRKHNPFQIGDFFRPGPPEIVTFPTDFGVEFGLFICFDILWNTPGGKVITEKRINNIVFPTHWVNILFVEGSEIQQGYSQYYQANLLASNNVETSTGSGIFSRGRPLTYTDEIQTKLLIADVPIFDFQEPPNPGVTRKLPWKPETSFNVFSASPGIKTHLSASLNSHICDFGVQVKDGNEVFLYGAIRFESDGIRTEACVFANCGFKTPNMTNCHNEKPLTSFDFLKVNMTIVDDVRVIFPLISTTGNAPVREFDKIDFSHGGNSHIFTLDGVLDPISFAVNFGVMNVSDTTEI